MQPGRHGSSHLQERRLSRGLADADRSAPPVAAAGHDNGERVPGGAHDLGRKRTDPDVGQASLVRDEILPLDRDAASLDRRRRMQGGDPWSGHGSGRLGARAAPADGWALMVLSQHYVPSSSTFQYR